MSVDIISSIDALSLERLTVKCVRKISNSKYLKILYKHEEKHGFIKSDHYPNYFVP